LLKISLIAYIVNALDSNLKLLIFNHFKNQTAFLTKKVNPFFFNFHHKIS